MEYKEILEEIKPELEDAFIFFKGELMKIRSGRISPGLIENIKVDFSGTISSIKQLGAISVPSSNEILVQVWSDVYREPVIKAIESENLGLGIRVDGNNIYLSSPPLTEDSKRNLIKVLNQKKEEVFQNIRRIRDKAWKEIREGFQKGDIREDDKYKGKDKLEELVGEYKTKIEEMAKNKEKEIQG